MYVSIEPYLAILFRTPFQRNTKDRGTYKVSKPRSRVLPSSDEEDILRQSQTDDEKLSRQKGSSVKFGNTHTLSKGELLLLI